MMTGLDEMATGKDKGNAMVCPACDSQAIYRYGRTRALQQRYICLMCGRQFIPGHHRHYPKERPQCPACGARMHLYTRKEEARAVFRCSHYPICRTYLKVDGTLMTQ
jgi:transposase-like protein